MKKILLLLLTILSINAIAQTTLVKTVILQDKIYNSEIKDYKINSISGKMITVALEIKQGREDEELEVISVIINDKEFKSLSQFLLVERKDYETHKTLYCINSLGHAILIKYNETDFELYSRPVEINGSYGWGNTFIGINLK